MLAELEKKSGHQNIKSHPLWTKNINRKLYLLLDKKMDKQTDQITGYCAAKIKNCMS